MSGGWAISGHGVGDDCLSAGAKRYNTLLPKHVHFQGLRVLGSNMTGYAESWRMDDGKRVHFFGRHVHLLGDASALLHACEKTLRWTRTRIMLTQIQRGAKKIKLSLVTHVPSGLMGCASAALGWWVGGRRQILTCLNFFAPRCTVVFLPAFA